MPDVPSISREEPVLMSIEEDVLGSARSVVDGGSGDDPECRRARELNPDVDADLSMHGFRYCQREQRREHESFHGLPTLSGRDERVVIHLSCPFFARHPEPRVRCCRTGKNRRGP
jgi:hypothetical protein